MMFEGINVAVSRLPALECQITSIQGAEIWGSMIMALVLGVLLQSRERLENAATFIASYGGCHDKA